MNVADPPSVDQRFDLPLAEITSDLVRQFHQHWTQLCRGGRLPGRSDLEPENFKRLLPNIILVAIQREPFRVHYRLCGTRVVDICGNLAGRYLDEIAEAKRWSPVPYIEVYRTATRERRPVFVRDWIPGEFSTRHCFQAGRWPLASDGQNVDMCIGVEDYLNARPAGLSGSRMPAGLST